VWKGTNSKQQGGETDQETVSSYPGSATGKGTGAQEGKRGETAGGGEGKGTSMGKKQKVFFPTSRGEDDEKTARRGLRNRNVGEKKGNY